MPHRDRPERAELDSTGLGILIGARKRAAAYGGWLRLTVPRMPQARKVFAVAGLTRLFVFVPGAVEAVVNVAGAGCAQEPPAG